MKKINTLIIISAIIFSLLSGCNKFDDINTNPDTTTRVSASMLCTNVVMSMCGRGQAKSVIAQNALPKFVGYANDGQMDEQYNKLGQGSFGGMTLLPNIDKMVEYASGSVTENSYKGVAKFARAFLFYELTMQMGDIPYSEADKGEIGQYRPGYDTQQKILIGILDDLKEADKYFANGVEFSGDPSPYNGDPDKWRRASNAFALKVLMSLSKKADVSSLNIKSRFNEIVSAGFILEQSTGSFGLQYSSKNKHPLAGTNDLFTSRTILSSTLINNLKLLNDRRIFYFGEPAAVKISAGKVESDTAAYVGVDISMDYAAMCSEFGAGKFTVLNKRYLTEDACEPYRLITYAEQELILAEARIYGWITSGTAQSFYENGVKSALADVMTTDPSYAHQRPIDQSYINGYFSGEAAFKSSTADQLHQIWMQRYLLNFMQDAETCYFEYRRNGYPVFPINPATSLNENNKNGLPLRWLYPSSETTYNRDNLINALNTQYDGFDETNKVMWLLK
jgi:hypothetical protein